MDIKYSGTSKEDRRIGHDKSWPILWNNNSIRMDVPLGLLFLLLLLHPAICSRLFGNNFHFPSTDKQQANSRNLRGRIVCLNCLRQGHVLHRGRGGKWGLRAISYTTSRAKDRQTVKRTSMWCVVECHFVRNSFLFFSSSADVFISLTCGKKNEGWAGWWPLGGVFYLWK